MLHTRYRQASKKDGRPLNDLCKYYYGNPDLRLLLNLLAESSGTETSLRVLALFDRELNNSFKPEDIKFQFQKQHSRLSSTNVVREKNCQKTFIQKEIEVYDVKVTFKHAPARNGIISHMKEIQRDIQFMYTIELSPATKTTYVIPVIIDRPKFANDQLSIEDKEGTTKSNLVKELEHIAPLRDLEFSKEYSVRVNTIVNGKTLAYRTETFQMSNVLPHES